jgi:hypothetical protein
VPADGLRAGWIKLSTIGFLPALSCFVIEVSSTTERIISENLQRARVIFA